MAIPAKKRYSGLSVLNYMVTSNHIHLLVFDNGGRNVIPDSIKLTAGRTGQGYNIDDTFELREVITPFGNAANPDSENTYLWNQ